MSEIVFDCDDDFYDEDEMMCTTCNGTGTIHGCCDDLCRSQGWDEFGAACSHPRACFSCNGAGYIVMQPAALPPALGRLLKEEETHGKR